MKIIITLLAAALLCLSASLSAAGAEASSCVLKGDIDRDGHITAADVRAVVRVCAELDPMPEKGTGAYTAMKLTAPETDAVTMEDARALKRVAAGLDEIEKLYDRASAADLLGSLSAEVLSGGFASEHRVTCFSAEHGSISFPDGGNSPQLASVLSDGKSGEDSSYRLCEDITVSECGYPAAGLPAPEDIAAAEIGFTGSPDLFRAYSPEIADGKLLRYAKIGGERLLRLKVTAVEETYSAENGFSGGDRSPVFSLCGKDIRADAARYDLDSTDHSDGLTTSFSFRCREMTAVASAEYYVDPAAMLVLASRYTVTEKITADGSMEISYGGFTQKENAPIEIENVTEEIFIFTPDRA